MDNEAFRALVTERSKEKSTKEIAREAVEEEFRSRQSRSRAAGGRKRRRAGAGGGGGGGSSSDEDGGGGAASDDDDSDDGDVRRKEEADNDDENDGDEKEPKWKRERRAKKRAKDEAEGKIRYRDRAKERREGRTNADYAGIDAGEAAVAGADADSSSNVLGGADAEADNMTNMTKYLGGDESRTHLVKGLDLALAEKVRREEMGPTDDARAHASSDDVNLESILQSSRAERSDQEALRRAIQDLPSVATMSSSSDGNRFRADVVGLLHRLQSASQTTLGRDMAAFLVNKTNRGYGGSSSNGDQATELVVTNAGRTLQRTQLQFSLQCHPGDILRSWEVPREEVSSVADHDRRRRQSGGGADAPFGRKLTPLDGKFLARMKDALAPSMPTTPSDDKMSGASKKGRDGRKKSKHKGAEGRRGEEVTDTVANAGRLEHSSDAAVQVQPSAHTRNGNSGDGESSDDDIFGGIGTYQPSVPATAAAASNGGNRDTDNDTAAAAKKKKSIFAGLTAATVDKPKRESAPVSNATAVRSTNESNVIDRDVFGARPMGAGASSAGGHRPSGGGSMSTSDYAGGYGEEMDTDFAGADDQEMEQSKRDKGGNLTTTAALEYGRRSGGSTLDS